MRPKYDCYIAGSMHGRTVGDVLAERARAKLFCKHYGITYYDPAEDEGLEKLSMDHVIDLKPDMERMRWFVDKDDAHVDQCQSLLVLTGDKSTSGSGWEMGRAFYKTKIPIFLVAPKMARLQLVNFTTIKADFICSTQEEAISLIADYLSLEASCA